MSPAQILKETMDSYSEYLEMMDDKEKFIYISHVLTQKLASEIAMKEHYKSCWNASMKPSSYKGINS